MKYYKIINENAFVGVGTTIDLRRFQQKHQILLSCDESMAQYIQFEENLYRDSWMVPESTDKVQCETANVIEIDNEEYDNLLLAVKTNQEIKVIQEPEPIVEEPSIDEQEQITIDYIRSTKISEMSIECEKAIYEGFEIELSDGVTHHFSLSEKDQLNLIAIQGMILGGVDTIPYHADNEPCEYYTAVDMSKVIKKANSHKTYHISYFNSLKLYINSLSNIGAIMSIYYGVNIPKKYQSKVLQSLAD